MQKHTLPMHFMLLRSPESLCSTLWNAFVRSAGARIPLAQLVMREIGPSSVYEACKASFRGNTPPIGASKTDYTLLSRTFAPATGAFLATGTDYLQISRTWNPHEPETPTTGVFAHKTPKRHHQRGPPRPRLAPDVTPAERQSPRQASPSAPAFARELTCHARWLHQPQPRRGQSTRRETHATCQPA